MWIIILIVFCLLVAGIIILRKAGGGSFPWFAFYAKGKESGFSFTEVNLLRKVSVENRLDNPTSLFWSLKQLDKSIKGTITKLRSEGKVDDGNSLDFMSKLFDFRRRVEMNLPKYKLGLKTSRKIAIRQRIKITLPGGGAFNSSVVENLRRYLAVSYPEGQKLPDEFSWKGQKIGIYFWRADDAGYVFQTKVIDDFYQQKYPILHINHSDSLIRSQKRSSLRVIVNKPSLLYPLKTIEIANEQEEKTSGLRCRLIDISSDGAAVLIGGRAKVGLSVKIRFTLTDVPLYMCGVVKGVSFNPGNNQSSLHIQASNVSLKTQNAIYSFVYNIFGEQDLKTANKKARPVR